MRSTGRPRVREDEPMPSTSTANRAPSSNIPELLNNLAMIAAATNDAVVASTSQQNYTASNRSPRRRNSSESSNCEETKISITAVVNHSVGHWNQVGVNLPKIPEGSHSVLLTQVRVYVVDFRPPHILHALIRINTFMRLCLIIYLWYIILIVFHILRFLVDILPNITLTYKVLLSK